MAAIALPTSPGVIAPTRPRLIDRGGLQEPPLGGRATRVDRLGSRHALDVTLPPMDAATAMPWIQRLKRGKSERVLMRMPQPGFTPGAEGTPTIRSNAAGGTAAIAIRGVARGHALSEGQFLSIIVAGERYLYACDNAEAASTSALTYTEHQNVDIASLGSAVYRVAKDAGGADWNASAYSAQVLRGDFLIRFQPKQTNGDFIVGVDPDPPASFNPNFARGVYFKNDGTADAYQGGTLLGAIGAYTTGQWWFLCRAGAVLTLLRGTTADVAQATLVGSFTDLAGPLQADSSIYHSGSAFDVYGEEYYHASVEITPMLRTAVTTGDTVEIATPIIEGYPAGDETGWDVNEAAHYGLAFTIGEAE